MTLVVPVVACLCLLVGSLPVAVAEERPGADPGSADGRAHVDSTAAAQPGRYADVAARWLELLGEAVPRARRVSILVMLETSHPDAAGWSTIAAGAGHAARRRGLRPEIMTVRHRGELLDAFVMMRQTAIEAVVVLPTPLALARAADVAAQATRYGLPLIGGHRRFVDAGALMSYGTRRRSTGDGPEGVGPADTPGACEGAALVDGSPEPGSRFELLINDKVARALGLPIAASLRQRADQIIE